MKWISEYKCLKCEYEWKQKAGPTQCPDCGHLYILWVNYDELAKKKPY
jgi:DNA-directed RNA polymerase subunit RPC12/RpoP